MGNACSRLQQLTVAGIDTGLCRRVIVCPRLARQLARRRSGFTLVELLVVIAIIGILVSLLLPAVQSARESARMVQCKNNLRQVALACIAHNSSRGHFPACGSGDGTGNGNENTYKYAGDPAKGYGKDQPGGWHYNILPFLEQTALHDLGLGLSDTARKETGKQIASTVVSTFVCPSRAEPKIDGTFAYSNINKPDFYARSDYAGNAGDRKQFRSLYYSRDQNGVIYSKHGFPAALMRDGLSNTYLIGERYINPDYYRGGYKANDQGWTGGYDHDVVRWTDPFPEFQPRQDTPGIDSEFIFGSAHPLFHMAFCDGNVRGVSYSIDSNTHCYLGDPRDGQAINSNSF